MRVSAVVVAVFVAALAVPAAAEEGMWLINAFPKEAVQKSYGTAPDDALLRRLQRGAVRLAGGCSASFVGKNGLVMTNHHCIRPCLEELSTGKRDLLGKPFVAASAGDELRCEKVEANQLVDIKDVSSEVLAATKGARGAEFQAKLKAEKARIEGACVAQSSLGAAGADEKAKSKVRCDVVTLFDGAAFHLYTYRRHQDVRLVFAPEFQMAAFGGDPDNFNFPRFGLDMAFLRVWDDGKPLVTDDALRFRDGPAREGELVYIAGHPGGTERLRTATQLELQRDVALPWTLLRLAELRGRLDEWMKADPKRRTIGAARLRTVENGLKALRGRQQTLAQKGFLDERRRDDAALAAKVPAVKDALADVDAADAEARALWPTYRLLESGEAFHSELFDLARLLVRLEAESKKPDAERLPEYTSSRLPAVRQQLLSKAVIPLDFEAATLGWSLERLRNLRGADDPVVQRLVGTKSPAAVAAALVKGTRLKDPQARALALEGKLDLSKDPMIVFARSIDDDARAVRKKWEDGVEARETRAAEALAAARRSVRGTSGAPDATFTLRVSYGQVKGTSTAPPWTTVGGLLARSADVPPFLLASSWQQAKSRLSPETQMNLSTTNDMIGGNSGSPALDKDGRIIGLIFDGNLASLGGRFTYDADENRAVAVAASTILEALDKVYGARRVLDELRAP